MSEVKSSFKYSKDHEWVEVFANKKVRIGITDYAQQSLGDIVFVELPEVGTKIVIGETFSSVESVKAVSEIFSPVCGTVIEINDILEDLPELINEEPYDKGWIVQVEVNDEAELEQLLSAEEYEALLQDKD